MTKTVNTVTGSDIVVPLGEMHYICTTLFIEIVLEGTRVENYNDQRIMPGQRQLKFGIQSRANYRSPPTLVISEVTT